MKYYIDENDQIFAFEPDGSQDHLISKEMASVASERLDSLLASQMSEAAYDSLLTKARHGIRKLFS